MPLFDRGQQPVKETVSVILDSQAMMMQDSEGQNASAELRRMKYLAMELAVWMNKNVMLKSSQSKLLAKLMYPTYSRRRSTRESKY